VTLPVLPLLHRLEIALYGAAAGMVVAEIFSGFGNLMCAVRGGEVPLTCGFVTTSAFLLSP
jgi:hypothetical protein